MSNPNQQYSWFEEEDVADYRPGGFHPVHIGDIFSGTRTNDRPYRVLRKIGRGILSTVWLAEDMQHPRKRGVALKINRADMGYSCNELRVAQWLRTRPQTADHPGRDNVLIPIDCFILTGPNGTHDVIVSELVASVWTFEDRPLTKRKELVRHLFQGLAYLHAHGVVHGDAHTENVGLSLTLLTSSSAEHIAKGLRLSMRSLDGYQTPHRSSLPPYVVSTTPIASFLEPLVTPRDLNSAVLKLFDSVTPTESLILCPIFSAYVQTSFPLNWQRGTLCLTGGTSSSGPAPIYGPVAAQHMSY